MSDKPTSDYDYLSRHRTIWSQKKVLRQIYGEQYYARLLRACTQGGRILEIGSGPGLLAEFAPNVWRTDVLPSPWVHCAADAHHLPFADSTIDNIIGLDVLHHFNQPIGVMKEVLRVLRPGGRFVLVEPWITPFSRLVYTYFHQETCDLNARPWEDNLNQFEDGKKAFDGNAAIPYLLIQRGADSFQKALPDLKFISMERFSLFTYLLSFGFKPLNMLPAFLYKPAYMLEEASRPAWAKLAALRALMIWEKTA